MKCLAFRVITKYYRSDIRQTTKTWVKLFCNYAMGLYFVQTKANGMSKTIEVDLTILSTVVDISLFLDYYKKKYKATWPLALIGLNEKEEAYVTEHPFYALGAVYTAMIAMDGAGPGVDDEHDALRHCYWAAMMTRMMGEAEARVILANHEAGQNNPMDNHNNEVGIKIGNSKESITEACQEAVRSGKLMTSLFTAPKPPTPAKPATKPPSSTGGKSGGKGKNDGGRNDGGAGSAHADARADRGGGGAKAEKGGGSDAKPDKGGIDKGGGIGPIGRPGLG